MCSVGSERERPWEGADSRQTGLGAGGEGDISYAAHVAYAICGGQEFVARESRAGQGMGWV